MSTQENASKLLYVQLLLESLEGIFRVKTVEAETIEELRESIYTFLADPVNFNAFQEVYSSNWDDPIVTTLLADALDPDEFWDVIEEMSIDMDLRDELSSQPTLEEFLDGRPRLVKKGKNRPC